MKTKTSPSFTAKRLEQTFTEIAKLITSTLKVEKVIDAIMEQVHLLFKPRNWSLLRLDPTSQELFFIVAKGINKKIIQNVRLKLGEGIAGRVAKTGKPLFVQDAEHHPYFSKKVDQLSGFKTRSLIAVPIRFQKKVLGVIELVNAIHDRPFTKHEVTLLETIADFAAIALTNAIAYEHIVLLASRDPLTGLYNRARLEKLILNCSKSFSRRKGFQSSQSKVISVVIDIDHFKEINDKKGHRYGDQLLTKVSVLLQNILREEDFAFRIGGDEFLLLIMNVENESVPDVIKRLEKKLLSNLHLIAPASFSFGIAFGAKKEIKKLIHQADLKMYQYKIRKNARRGPR